MEGKEKRKIRWIQTSSRWIKPCPKLVQLVDFSGAENTSMVHL